MDSNFKFFMINAFTAICFGLAAASGEMTPWAMAPNAIAAWVFGVVSAHPSNDQ